jgi:CHAD domain-containing protein
MWYVEGGQSMPHATTQVVTALSRAIRRNAEAFARDLSRARRGDVRAVHRVRVATRRLRAALALAGDAGGADGRSLTRDIKRITRALGHVREADVVRELLLDLGERQEWSPAVVAYLEEVCVDRRRKPYAAMKSRLSRVHAHEFESRLKSFAGRIEQDASAATLAAGTLADLRRRARAMSDAMEHAGTVYGIEPLHKVRIATKKLRYAIEAADGAFDGGAELIRRRLKRFQDRLGEIHDTQIAQGYVRAAQAGAGLTPAMTARLVDVDRALDVQSRRLHGQVLAQRAQMVKTVTAILDAVQTHMTPRAVGRMARMRGGRTPRRAQAGA